MVLVQQGDRDAYAVLFARWQDRIWSFLVRRTGNRELASDLFQETFLRIWRSARTFKPGQPFRPWLFRVSANIARDRYRREQRMVDTAEIELERVGERIGNPVDAMDLERAVDRLPDTLREAFLLGVVEGMDHNEVAAVLDITPVNARARISRARAKLRDLLKVS